MRKQLNRLICTGMAIGLAGLLAFSPLIATASTVSPTLTRLGGGDQYETAAKIAEQGWTGTTDDVVLSAGMTPNLVDALAAGPLSTKLKAPMILTDGGNTLNTWAKQELQRLKPSKAYITSGTAVIKQSVLEELKEMGIAPIQLGGYDQYETSVNIAKEMLNQGVSVSQVVIASGTNPADALSIASIAAAQGMPILATSRDSLPSSVKSFLDSLSGVNNSYVIGGSAVVGNTVQAQLPGTVQRYAGLTKYDTNISVLKGFSDVLKKDKTYVANGETLVDALAGVSLAAQTSSAILLTAKTLPTTSCDYALLNLPSEYVALGGQAVVPQSVFDEVMTTEPLPESGSGTSTGGGGGSTSGSVKIQNLKAIMAPAYGSGKVSNGSTYDLSGAPETTHVIGFSITVNQSCDLQLDDFGITIPLSGGEATQVNLDDLIPGTEGGNGVSLKTLRVLYGDSILLQGKLLKKSSVVADLSLTLKL